ncbi:MAG TPA: L,D-transpeptidase [Gemmatimonadaceae bacterium]|nr:L,D-transpeptidase [Gemmatimonadaceae bacterium]
MSSTTVLIASVFALSITGSAAALGQAQGYESFRRQTGQALTSTANSDAGGKSRQDSSNGFSFRSRKDSIDWARNRKLAEKSTGFRVVVSLQERRLWVVIDEDTLLNAPASVATGKTLTYQGREWTFDTPRGERRVQAKDADPIWQPPDWLYYETAAELGLKVKVMPSKGLTMPDGRRLYINEDNEVGVIDSEGPTRFADKNLHLIFDGVLYIPPLGTENRKVNGTLGKYKLVLGEGYLFHGTPHKNSIGLAATHGCIRLRDEDIEWMYENIPVGTKVYIY